MSCPLVVTPSKRHKMPQTNWDKAAIRFLQCESIARRVSAVEDSIMADVEEKNSSRLKARCEFLAQHQEEYKQEFENGVALLMASTSDKRDVELQQRSKAHDVIMEMFDRLTFDVKAALISLEIDCPKVSTQSRQRLPKFSFRDFDEDDPSFWFAQLEIQFKAQAVTLEEEKFALMQQFLTKRASDSIKDLTENPPAVNPFTAAVRQLNETFGQSLFDRLDKAFDMTAMDVDEKATGFRNRFRSLLKDASIDDIEKWAVYRVMPQAIKPTVVNSDFKTSLEMAVAVDALLPSVRTSPQMRSTLAVSVCKVTKEVKKASKPRFELCDVHAKFGRFARSCSGTKEKKCAMWYSCNLKQKENDDAAQ